MRGFKNFFGFKKKILWRAGRGSGIDTATTMPKTSPHIFLLRSPPSVAYGRAQFIFQALRKCQ